MIWHTDAIVLDPPADAPGRHVVAIEVLLGTLDLPPSAVTKGPLAIVTLDAADGPRYLHRLDRGPVEAVARAAGIDPGRSSPP